MPIEYDVANYLVHHKDGIKEDLRARVVCYDKEAIVQEVIIVLTQGLNLVYDDVASVVDYDFLYELLGSEFFDYE